MTGVFLLAWILFTIAVFFVVYKRVCYLTSSQEQFQDVYDPTDLTAFFKPFQVNEVCTIFQYIYPKLVQSESLGENQQRKSDEQAREAAQTVLKRFIPGEILKCPVKIPAEKTIEAADEFLSTLPDTYLATVYATLVYCTKNLQQSIGTMTTAIRNADAAKQEGFTNVCSKDQADEKRKAQASLQCTLPEELTDEQKKQIELTKKQRIQAKLKTLVDTYTSWRQDTLAKNEKALQDMKGLFERTKGEKELLDKRVKEAGQDVPEELSNKQQAVSEAYGPLELKYNELLLLRTNLQQSTASLVQTCQSILPKLEKIKGSLEEGNYSSSILEGFFQSPLR